MRTKLTGILLKKSFFKSNFIGSILLNNGKRISLIFYGGKKLPIEVGYAVWLEVGRGKIPPVKEWGVVWQHKTIRYRPKAYFLLCFFLNLADRLSHEDHLLDDEIYDEWGLYSLLANGLFYLDAPIRVDSMQHAGVFLGKLLKEMGIFPRLQNCALCERALDARVVWHERRFCCGQCVEGESMNSCHFLLQKVKKTLYKDHEEIQANEREVRFLYQYLCAQLDLPPFPTFEMIF